MKEDQDSNPMPERQPNWKFWISKRVKDLRGDMPLGMLSIMSGLSEEHLHRIEASEITPSKTSLRKIATALNISENAFEQPIDKMD